MGRKDTEHFHDRTIYCRILFLWHFILARFSKDIRKMELDDVGGPFKPKTFYNSRLASTGLEWAQIW